MLCENIKTGPGQLTLAELVQQLQQTKLAVQEDLCRTAADVTQWCMNEPASSENQPEHAGRYQLLGLILALVSFGLCLGTGQSLPWAGTVGTTVLCAVWWMTECVPIPATSMLPFLLLPLCGALSDKSVAGAYGHPMILLLLGGFFLSLGLERSGVHKRLALMLLQRIGQSPRALMLGVIVSSAGFSMWISNTATTLAMLPIVLALVAGSENQQWRSRMLLGVAYGASIGGMGTPIGTPPNAILMSVASESPQIGELSFVGWMGMAMPVVALFIPVLWLWLSRGSSSSVTLQLPQLTGWTSRERRALLVFCCAAGLWVTRPLWAEAFPMIGDSSIALGGAALLFVIPCRSETGALLKWSDSRDIPWGLLLLFGSGIAIAKAFQSTGISEAPWNVVDR